MGQAHRAAGGAGHSWVTRARLDAPRPVPGPGCVSFLPVSRDTPHEWQKFLRDHNLVSSMGRYCNCHDNAVAESFFQLLKRERIRRRIYATREDASAEVFKYIEMFYNPIRRHSSTTGLSPVEFEQRHAQGLEGV